MKLSKRVRVGTGGRAGSVRLPRTPSPVKTCPNRRLLSTFSSSFTSGLGSKCLILGHLAGAGGKELTLKYRGRVGVPPIGEPDAKTPLFLGISLFEKHLNIFIHRGVYA